MIQQEQNDFSRFDIAPNSVNGVEEQQPMSSIAFTWKWNDLETSVFVFSGKIAASAISDKTQIEGPRNLKTEIAEILSGWDGSAERYKIQLNAIDSNVLDSFECPYSGKWKDFSVHIDALPVEPYNAEEALQWRNRLLDVKLAEDYLHPADFESTVSSLNQKDGFKAYAQSLSVPRASEYRDNLLPSKKSETSPAYWHLSAPLDLNPELPQKANIGSFSLLEGNETNYTAIVAKMDGASAEKVFYYDKFVLGKIQQHKAAAFLSAFSAAVNPHLITDTANQEPAGPLARSGDVIQHDISGIFKTGKAQHDRYVIMLKNGGLEVWSTTNSFNDCIVFSEKNIAADTKGKMRQAATFTKVPPEILSKELREFINKEAKQ
jgi:hypothetical protein